MILRLDRLRPLVLVLSLLLIPILASALKYQEHKVRKGDTLYALSKKYGVSVDELKKLNGLNSPDLSIGQVLKIKVAVAKPVPKEEKKPPAPVPTPVSEAEEVRNTQVQNPATTGPPGSSVQVVSAPRQDLPEQYYHTIAAKENLYRISLIYGIKVKDILAWNGFADDNQLIKPGDRIIVKDPAQFSGTSVAPADSQPQGLELRAASAPDSILIQRVYIVQRKDTLFKIATENGMTVEELKRLNNLSSNDISVGQKLNLVTPRGNLPTESSSAGLTEEIVRSRDRIRTDLFMPVEGKVISEYGIRNGRPHKGIDIGAKTGTPIYAVLDGTVVFSGYQGAYGNVIVMEHPDFVMTVYAHNEKNMVEVGATVSKGQQIGTVGSTGNANGSHLHFEYRIKGKAINPRKVLPFE